MKGNYHNHTARSFDSSIRPRRLLSAYVEAGFTEIAVTDHDRLDGAMEVARMSEQLGHRVSILKSAEVSTRLGEIIGLGIEEPVERRDPERVVRDIRDQGGVVYLPHPFKRSAVCGSTVLMAGIDAIEVVNGRASLEQNLLALALCLEHQKVPLGGSDAHLAGELGNVWVEADAEPVSWAGSSHRHCEERSDEAIQSAPLDCFASLAMTSGTPGLIPWIRARRSGQALSPLVIRIGGHLAPWWGELLSQGIKLARRRSLSTVSYLWRYALQEPRARLHQADGVLAIELRVGERIELQSFALPTGRR